MHPIMYLSAGEVHNLNIAGYPDGLPLVLFERVFPERILVRPRTIGDLMTVLFWVDAMSERGVEVPELVLPFFPGARQDRLNGSGDYLFTAKSVALEINARQFPEVVVVDPHSDVVPALVDRCRVITAADCIKPPAGKYSLVVSPDAGAEKRAALVAKKLGVPMLRAWKTRDVTSGKITGFGMEPAVGFAPGALALVVDDICDGGGTFAGLAPHIAGMGLKAHLWTTHGIYSQGTSSLLEHYGHLYCTDSFEGPREGVIEVGVCDRLLKGTL